MAARFQARSHGLDRFLPPVEDSSDMPEERAPQSHEPDLEQESRRAPELPRPTEQARATDAPAEKKRSSGVARAKSRAVMVFLRREDEELLERERQRRLKESSRRRGRTEVSTLIRDAIRSTYGVR